MLPKKIVERVINLTSGIRAKEYASTIARFHRIQISPGIHDAIDYVRHEVSGTSNANLKVFEYEADGDSPVETWTTPMGWNPKSGRLELIEPEKKVLADFQAEPISLIAHSKSANGEFDVVYVGKGIEDSDYEGIDVTGKLVLTESRAKYVHKIACLEKGAAGVLTYVPPKGIDEIATLRRYDAIWPTKEESGNSKFGFALTQADGLELKQILEKKAVKVKVSIDAKLEVRKMEVLSALIPGKDESKEVWLFAHICHPNPGANDNASGSGALLETLRIISAMIKNGEVEQPEVGIRFLWGPEWSGTIKLIDGEKELLERCIGMINLDMVGADQCKSGSVLNLYRTPFSLPTTLNNVVAHWLENEDVRECDVREGGSISPRAFAYRRYSAGSDHFMFTDSTVKIPAIMLNQSPDKFYHTSTDTTDKLDPVQMAYAARIAILSTLTLSYPKFACKELILTSVRNEGVSLMQEVSSKGIRQLARCLGDPEKVYPRVLRWLRHAHDLAENTLEVAKSEWHLIPEQERFREALDTSLEMTYSSEMLMARKAYEGACAEVGLEPKDEDQIDFHDIGYNKEVKRKIKYALSPSDFLRDLGKDGLEYWKLREKDEHILDRIDELFNLSIQWNSLDTIYDFLCFQFGDFDDKILSKIVKDLENLNYIESRDV